MDALISCIIYMILIFSVGVISSIFIGYFYAKNKYMNYVWVLLKVIVGIAETSTEYIESQRKKIAKLKDKKKKGKKK